LGLILAPMAWAATAAAEQPPVATSTLRQSPVRGIVRAVEQASISTELATRVAAVHFREGEVFRLGQKLVEFDCRRQLATLAASEAQQLEMQLGVDKLHLLQRAQSVGRNDLEVSEARLAKAKAEAEALRSQLDQCVVVAPFDGRVLELSLQKHEAAQPGKPFIALVAHGNLEVDLIVPSDWVRWIRPSTAFVFHVDELRRPMAAMVTRIGAAVDPISQTVKIAATFSAAGVDVLPGMSGTAEFPDSGE
jgi:membrane fusion protein, multidrug efflux system